MGILQYFRNRKTEAERQRAKAHHWNRVQKAADMAISEMVRQMAPDAKGAYVYAEDVQRVGRENFNLEIPIADAHAALHHRLTFRGYNPVRFAPVFNFDQRTPFPNEPNPCDGYDYRGANSWCRRCGWFLGDHPEYAELTEGEK
ncbi:MULTISPECIES: hypothetical protein [unclassified Streptomyces]|uniref:hypothetical protein n=1 Tax=unclassified Streptomyces TaxID=2593676 RepID=UPI00381F64B2